MHRPALFCTATLLVALTGAGLRAHAPSGAIFTTLPDGTEVNFNHYPEKEYVFLDGGPGPGAPATAAGLDDGTYVFQVTEPSGKVLLSTDNAACRQFTVAGGVINGIVAAGGCEHLTWLDADHNATTVQLMPYKDTRNPGGVYKVWAIRVEDFLAGCAALGVPNGLDVVDCGYNAGNPHGFVPSHSKTDNFKVKEVNVREIDTRFYTDANLNGRRDSTEPWIDGLQITWNDPVGGSNVKSSYYNPSVNVFHEAHVEAIEDGIHRITVANQPGCTVGLVQVAGAYTDVIGPQIVEVAITKRMKEITIFVDVGCVPQ